SILRAQSPESTIRDVATQQKPLKKSKKRFCKNATLYTRTLDCNYCCLCCLAVGHCLQGLDVIVQGADVDAGGNVDAADVDGGLGDEVGEQEAGGVVVGERSGAGAGLLEKGAHVGEGRAAKEIERGRGEGVRQRRLGLLGKADDAAAGPQLQQAARA